MGGTRVLGRSGMAGVPRGKGEGEEARGPGSEAVGWGEKKRREPRFAGSEASEGGRVNVKVAWSAYPLVHAPTPFARIKSNKKAVAAPQGERPRLVMYLALCAPFGCRVRVAVTKRCGGLRQVRQRAGLFGCQNAEESDCRRVSCHSCPESLGVFSAVTSARSAMSLTIAF